MAFIRKTYTSCSCNSSPHCLDWGDVIAFATCNAVALYDVAKQYVVHTLVGHQKLVTCVKWIRSSNGKDEEKLVSCSAEKVVIWNRRNNLYESFDYVIADGKSMFTAVDAIHYQDASSRKLVVAVADSEHRIIVSEKANCDGKNDKQIINLKRGLALTVRFCLLSTKFPLLAVGSSECVVSLYTKQNNGQFACVCLLHGHEDWIRGLDFSTDVSGRTFLASCSQDCLIRIWKIARVENVGDSEPSDVLKLKEIVFTYDWEDNSTDFIVTLESVCEGHENWVYGVHWQPSIKTQCSNSPAKLLSSSMDKTMIVWEFDESSGLWLEKARVGDVGGNTLGFCGGVFSPNGLSILGHSHQGALHLWHYKEELKIWEASYAISGHFQEVEDIVWEEQGNYILSCSADQTVRLHAPHKQTPEVDQWNEVARPQIHGYNINCLAMINRCKFVSGADEKVLRVFEASKNFITNMQTICQIAINTDTSGFAEGATVPPLGLSNKAIFESDLTNNLETEHKHPKDHYPDSYFMPSVSNHPPSEDILLQNTLWPEVQKLYGHGYEIYAVACNHAGTVVASACKASKPDHAGIILWDTNSWKQIAQVYSHALTVTQIAFSPNDCFLLSVSRDRTWAMFKKNSETNTYERIDFSNKSTGIHTRIIWSCSWSHNNKYFATGSRDKTVIIWGSVENDQLQRNTDKWIACTVPFMTSDAVTAVDFAPTFAAVTKYLIAVGLEKGEIQLFMWEMVTGQTEDWQIFATLDCNAAHHKTVRRLRFCPVFKTEKDKGKQLKLASCSHDHSVKIFTVFVL